MLAFNPKRNSQLSSLVRQWRTDIEHSFENRESCSPPDFVLSFILRDPFDDCLHMCLDLDDHEKSKAVWNDLEKGNGGTLSKQDLFNYIRHHSLRIQCEGLEYKPYFKIIEDELETQPGSFSQAFLSLLHLFPYPLSQSSNRTNHYTSVDDALYFLEHHKKVPVTDARKIEILPGISGDLSPLRFRIAGQDEVFVLNPYKDLQNENENKTMETFLTVVTKLTKARSYENLYWLPVRNGISPHGISPPCGEILGFIQFQTKNPESLEKIRNYFDTMRSLIHLRINDAFLKGTFFEIEQEVRDLNDVDLIELTKHLAAKILYNTDLSCGREIKKELFIKPEDIPDELKQTIPTLRDVERPLKQGPLAVCGSFCVSEPCIEECERYQKGKLFDLLIRLAQIKDKQLEIKRQRFIFGTKSAVAAIISRNHSHHIGSHVTPRCTLEKVIERLDHLGYQETSFEKKATIAGILKARLDQYIQKKADFLSEIVTEPLTTTRTLGFFNEIILPLVQSTLLMDNIGANEGVNYKKGLWNDNRLRIHAYFKDKELRAGMYGGDGCTCKKTCHTTDYPYSGHCKCKSPKPLQVIVPESSDVSVALPGPLGEFALYAFLENFIRNAVKHNQEVFRKDPDLYLDVHIKVSELPEDDSAKDDFYRIEIWEDVTRPSANLVSRLKKYIDDPVVDDYGRLRKGAWGIAEMKIMANLLRGSDDFSTMGSSLHVHGEDRLVYDFRLMKPKEIAVVLKGFPLSDDHIKKGIRAYQSLEDFAGSQKEARSLAGFNFAILGGDVMEAKEDFTHFLPNRIFIHQALNDHIPGSIEVDDRFMSSIRERDAGDMISFLWHSWIKSLPHLSDQEKISRIVLFFGQEEDSIPTSDWLEFAQKWEKSENIPRLSVIFQSKRDNKVSPDTYTGESLAVFDRHFDGYGALPENALTYFHEEFDKNSSDFVPIFSAQPSDLMIYRLAESALLKVLVLDERIAEVAYEEILQGERPDKPFYNSEQRIEVCRWGNIYLATHLIINGAIVKTLHHSIKNDLPQVIVETTIGTRDRKRIDKFNVYWADQGINGVLKKHKIRPHIIIMHQEVLEKFFGEKIPPKENESFVETLKNFVCSLRDFIPFVVVDSGRGMPANLPPDVKFMPFSLIQEFFMQERISKYSLIKTLMGLIRRGNQ